MRLVEHAQKKIASVLNSGDIAIDATVGNGWDTLFLAQRVGESGFVYGFDIQEEAIQITREKLRLQRVENHCRLILGSHAALDRQIECEHQQKIKAVMFNLGYLPGADKSITTTPASTLMALKKACSLLSPGGRISIVCYTFHPGGQQETDKVKKLLETLPENFRITQERPKGTVNSPPELMLIESEKRIY